MLTNRYLHTLLTLLLLLSVNALFAWINGSYTISNVSPGSCTLSLCRVTHNEFKLLFF